MGAPYGPGSRPTGRASKAVSPVPASIPSAGYPPGAISSRAAFVAGVKANGRQKKTAVYCVSCGGIERPVAPQFETREFIWPLKFTDELGCGSDRFAADVRGNVISLRDRHIEPNDYNCNFAFFDEEKATAYAASAIEARRVETERLDAQHESAVAKPGAKTVQP